MEKNWKRSGQKTALTGYTIGVRGQRPPIVILKQVLELSQEPQAKILLLYAIARTMVNVVHRNTANELDQGQLTTGSLVFILSLILSCISGITRIIGL